MRFLTTKKAHYPAVLILAEFANHWRAWSSAWDVEAPNGIWLVSVLPYAISQTQIVIAMQQEREVGERFVGNAAIINAPQRRGSQPELELLQKDLEKGSESRETANSRLK